MLRHTSVQRLRLASIGRVYHNQVARRSLIVIVGVVALVMLSRSSSAEFEFPYIDTTNALQAVEFHGIFSYNRGSDTYSSGKPDLVFSRYEAYAVGIDPNATGCTPIENCNGVLYTFDGASWKRVTTILSNGSSPFGMNAIAGQDVYGAPSPLYAVGVNGKTAFIDPFYNELGTFTSGLVGGDGKFTTDKVYTAIPHINGQPATGGNELLSTETRDFYTVGTGQGYNLTGLAGGQKGLVIAHPGRASNRTYGWDVITPTFSNIPKNGAAIAGHTRLDSLTANGSAAGDESVVSIRYANATDIYVLTTTFGLANSGPDSGLPKSPYAHDCSGGSNGNRNTFLYKTAGGGSYPSGISSWTLLASISGICGYDLAIGTPSTTPYTTGNIQHVLWMATSNGVYTYDEGTNTLTAPTITTPAYAVTAVPSRGGQGVNLLSNGSFDNHTFPSGVTTPSATTMPDGWVKTDLKLSYGTRNVTTGTCVNNGTGVNKDYEAITGYDDKAFGAIRIWPSASYYNGAGTSTCTNLDPFYTESFFQYVDLTSIEGQKFRITGKVRVEFPYTTAPAAPATNPLTKAPQGGVSVGCAGSVNNGIKVDGGVVTGSQVPVPGYTNCSLSNRKNIVTYTGSAGAGWTSATDTGWQNIDLTISREDAIFSSLKIRQDNGGTPTARRMFLQVACEATYGARVTCDNLKVEEVSDPPTPPRDTYTVLAAGPDLATNGFIVNTDAFHSTTFSREAVPLKVRQDSPGTLYDVFALSSLGLQHIYGVGRGYAGSTTSGVAIYNRTPSTLAGSIWLGATTPTGATSSSSLGNISVSCVDAKGTSARPTLCQESPESYGLSLEINSGTAIAKTGVLQGRAWYGEPSGGGADNESLNLGKCLRSPAAAMANPASYDLTGMCDYTPGTGISPLPPANQNGTRRCFSTTNHAVGTGAPVSPYSCLNDFDCYGRCERDEGFLCVTDSDCQVTSTSAIGSVGTSTGGLLVTPASRLTCGSFIGNVKASPLACRPTGWLTLNAADLSNSTPPSGTFGVTYNTLYSTHNSNYTQNPGAHEFNGWGRFMSLVNPSNPFDGGWVHFRGPVVAAVPIAVQTTLTTPPTNPQTLSVLYSCRDCDGAAAGSKNCAFCQDALSHSCIPSDTPTTAACFNVCKGSNPTPNGAGKQPWVACNNGNDCTAAGTTGPCIAPGYCSVVPASGPYYCVSDADCSTTASPAGPGGSCATGTLCSSTGSQCTQYGVNLDTETGQFRGYAWSQDFGWVDFRSIKYSTSRIIQTKLGDIYAKGQIGQAGLAQPIGGSSCNSTYLITSASTITGFCSTLGATVGTQQNALVIPSVSDQNSYQNILGRFDVTGMEKDVGTGKNKYGSTVNLLTTGTDATNCPVSTDISCSLQAKMNSATNSGGASGTISGVLGGEVYTIGTPGAATANTYTIDHALSILNSPDLTASNGSGAGILIINGNLIINKSITYGGGAIGGDLRRLASLTIVVRGNVTIDNSVQNIVGAYYVTDFTGALAGTGGSFNTKSSDVANISQFQLNGLLIAKAIHFGRQFAGTVENPAPSELVVFDGRLQSNPLPGMTDFASALPNTVKAGP